MLFERLLYLLHVLEQADIIGELRRRHRYAAEHRQHLIVELSRIGLAGDREAAVKAHLLGYHFVKSLDLVGVIVKQLHERSLRAGSAL